MTKQTPVHGATGLGTTVTLSWTTTLTDPGYWVCWDTTDNQTCDGAWCPNGGVTARQLTGLLPGTYWWQVRADTAQGSVPADGGTWWRFTVAGPPPPGAFTKTAPASGATQQPTSVPLSWGASTGATSYECCLDTTANGTCDSAWQPAGAVTTWMVSGLTPSTTYSWQVRARNGVGVTEASGGWWTFTVAAPASPLTKTSPAPDATGLGSTVTLLWTTTLVDPGYLVCWDTTDNGTCDTVWWPNGGMGGRQLTGLPAGTYYWQVQAVTAGGVVYADNGTWWRFTVGSAPEAASAPTGGADAAGSGAGLTEDTGAGAPPPMPGPGRAGAGAWLLLAGALALGVRARRWPGRRWAMPAWLSLVALLWPAGVVAQTGERKEYYHLDALGSVRVVTDANGQVLRRHDFRPFGEEVSPSYPSPERKLFTGQERDAETALDYFGARYYRADLGRFTTVDPGHVNGSVADPQSWNGYAYARNNPLRFIDPVGTDYGVIVEGGKEFWYGGSWSDFRSFATGFTLVGGPFSGTIYNAAGQAVGSYQYFDPFDRVLVDAGMRAEPGVTLAVHALRVFGYVVAPGILAVAECAADWAGCRNSGVMIAAALSPKVLRLLGKIAPLAENTVAQAIRLKGGGASQVNEVATYLQHMKLSEVAQRAANGDAQAVKALKMVKQAALKAQRY